MTRLLVRGYHIAMPPPPPTPRRTPAPVPAPTPAPDKALLEPGSVLLPPLAHPVPKPKRLSSAQAEAAEVLEADGDALEAADLGAGAKIPLPNGRVAAVGDRLTVESVEVSYLRTMLRLVRQGGDKQTVITHMISVYKIHPGVAQRLWRQLGVTIRRELSDPVEVDALVAAVVQRGAARQQLLTRKMRQPPAAPDPHSAMEQDKLSIKAAKASREEDLFLMQLLGTADQRWNKSQKVDVVGVMADNAEEREIMQRLLGPSANIQGGGG